MKTIKVSLVSLGCPKNLVDSETLLGILHKDGMEITLDENNADIVVVNTCSFIKEAEKESIRTVLELIETGKKVIIAGCLPQKYKHELKEALPEALAYVGTGNLQKIAEIIKGQTDYAVPEKPYHTHAEGVKRFHISVGSSAYIKIAEGCDYSCSFCVIPSLRGKYTSRTIESIVNEAKQLADEGLSEIILIAQDTTSYGKDIYGEPSLVKLLKKLNEVKGICWIRLMYFYPSLVTDELLETINTLDKIIKYVDIPLQHSHPDILRSMNRPAIDNGRVIERIRRKIPGVAIRTVFITGFPGETQEHFEHLYKFIEKYRFDKLGVFEYSKEESTTSGSLKCQIPAKTKKLRKNRLMELQQGISKQINEELIGRKIPAIIETVSPKQIVGRTYRDAPEVDGLVYIETDQIINPGDIVDVTITEAMEYDLYGRV